MKYGERDSGSLQSSLNDTPMPPSGEELPWRRKPKQERTRSFPKVTRAEWGGAGWSAGRLKADWPAVHGPPAAGHPCPPCSQLSRTETQSPGPGALGQNCQEALALKTCTHLNASTVLVQGGHTFLG